MGYESVKKAIVITSIFDPTEAVMAFSGFSDYKIIVVGDKKTPINWKCGNVEYLSVEQQADFKYELVKFLPFNHYCRKMLGYLDAIACGVEIIVDTDDDNIPKDDWTFPEFENKFDCISEARGFINIYQLFTTQKIWPRGLPLDYISKHFDLGNCMEFKDCKVGIWQGLADEDPDVDAIYRLTNNEPCYFEERKPVVLGYGTISPFNSQNTIFKKEMFALLYLPTYVTFRFTDILRGLVAQPIMHLYGYQLGFTKATVVQKRNLHNYHDDFISEIPMYQYAEKVIELVTQSIQKYESIEGNLILAYKALVEAGIVCEKELISLNAWISDLRKLS